MLIRSTWGRYGGNTVVLRGHYRWNTLGAPGRHGTGAAGTGLEAVCYIVTLGVQPGNVTNGSNALHLEWCQSDCRPVPGLAWKRAGFICARVVLVSIGLRRAARAPFPARLLAPAGPLFTQVCGPGAGCGRVMLNQLTISELTAKLALREVSARAATQAC
ncbi:MAG: hypothetical protein NTX51_17645, partial [Verrucomicrobia bacterium]|nr:hypothetical protein [Verrucomicrobiota bacterium]